MIVAAKQAQYHQYAPVGPHNPTLLGYQRNVHDLFLPNDFREEIQKRTAATLQTIPNLHLPAHVESYHSLVPLDTNQKSSTILSGYSSWIYKAQSSSSAKFFALRRIEGKRAGAHAPRHIQGSCFSRLTVSRLPADQRKGHSNGAELESTQQRECGWHSRCLYYP
jgi:hypothetical protein